MRIKRFTPAAAQIFNIIETDVGRSLLDITHKLDYDRLALDAQETFATLRTVEREVRSTDGHWYLARFLPYRTADDRINGAVLNFVDISSRLLTESRMHLGEERLRLLADSVPDFAMFTLDGDGNFSSWSGGAERLFGFSKQEILGRSFEKIFSEADREHGIPEAELLQSRIAGSVFADRWLARKEGSPFFASGTLTMLTAGVLRGYGMIVRDITHRHAEAGAAAAARQEAEASTRLKDEFLAIMSHELKHPLNLIHVNAQLLLSLPQTKSIPAVAKASETIERSVAAQARIIDDLLDLSRTQAGKLAIDCAPLDLAQALAPSLQWAEAQSSAKDIVLTHEGFDESLVVFADVVRIEQIVWNLLSNAIKFTGRGGKILVRLYAQGGSAVIEVNDNGRGIAARFLPHVFDMFMQEAGHLTRKEGGMGIGLGLVQALVRLHGGDVEAVSPGQGLGATFRVTFPLHERSEFAPLSSAVPKESPLRKLRILLVDDSADALETFAMVLRIEGAVVACASSGADALALCKKESFDLMISDVGMPDMDGNQLVEQLRRGPETALLPAIALTGYGRPQDIQAAAQAGFSGHLTKPVDMGKLRDLVAGLTMKQPS
jgi:two-component system CheB/CheR fusion protein